MVQVSRRFLKKDINDRIYSLFISSIVFCNSSDSALAFINDLFTPTERVMLAKRFSIAFMLSDGYDYLTISEMLKVSTSTIGSVALGLKNQGKGTRNIIGKIKKNETTKKIWEEIGESIMDMISSSRGMNWSQTKKDAFRYKMSHRKSF